MAEKDTIFSGKIKSSGIFNFKEVYGFCYAWLIDAGYFIIERTYSEKIGAGGKDITIKWECMRKISDYFRFKMKISWMILGMKDVEVEKNGNKIPMNKGYIEMKVQGILEKDYENRWENRPFFKFLRGLYDRYIIRGRIEQYEEKIYGETNEYRDQVKSFLALEGKS